MTVASLIHWQTDVIRARMANERMSIDRSVIMRIARRVQYAGLLSTLETRGEIVIACVVSFVGSWIQDLWRRHLPFVFSLGN